MPKNPLGGRIPTENYALVIRGQDSERGGCNETRENGHAGYAFGNVPLIREFPYFIALNLEQRISPNQTLTPLRT